MYLLRYIKNETGKDNYPKFDFFDKVKAFIKEQQDLLYKDIIEYAIQEDGINKVIANDDWGYYLDNCRCPFTFFKVHVIADNKEYDEFQRELLRLSKHYSSVEYIYEFTNEYKKELIESQKAIEEKDRRRELYLKLKEEFEGEKHV